MPAKQELYLPTLHGWRAIAISAVLLCHGFAPPDVTGLSSRARLISAVALRLGPQGVALFFAISGYLITTVLLRELEQRGRISLQAFYIRRFFRIMPPALLYLAVIGLFGALGVVTLFRGELLSGALWFSNYWPLRSWYTNHYWSLSMEEHFYLFWPGLLFLGVRRALYFGCVIVAGTAMWRPWALQHVHYMQLASLQRTDMRLDAFMFACILAIVVRQEGVGPRVVSLLVHPTVRIVAAVALAAALAAALLGEGASTRLLIESALFPVIVVSAVYSPGDWFGRLLESSVFKWLGRISYSVYLWQMPFLTPPANLHVAALWFPVRLACAILVAWASYQFVEAPCIAWGRNLANSRYRELVQGGARTARPM